MQAIPQKMLFLVHKNFLILGIRVKSNKKTYEYKYEQAKTLLPPEVKQAFSNRCAKEGVSESTVLRNAVHQFLNSRPITVKASK
jgi:hypothetical protein